MSSPRLPLVNLFFPTTQSGSSDQASVSQSPLEQGNALSHSLEQDVFTRRPPIFSLMDVAHWAPLLARTPVEGLDWLNLPFVNRFPDVEIGEVPETHRNASLAHETGRKPQTPDDFSVRDCLTEEGASALLDSPSLTPNPIERRRASSKESQIAPQFTPADDLWQYHLTDFLKEFEQSADRFTPEQHLAQPSDWFVKPNDDEPLSHFSVFAFDFGNQLTESPSQIWGEEQDTPSDGKPLLEVDKDSPEKDLSPKTKPAKVAGSRYTKEELEVKKQAVIKGYQLGETSPSVLSRKHQLPQSTVSTWLRRFKERPDSPFFKLRNLAGPSGVQAAKRKRTDEDTESSLLSPSTKR